ncbi:MAG: glucosaminidase domain-containing protein [Haliscomenobacter sp.]|nr:glucosaminidase domain-containing protein [Haliscomenobacter sp.]
MRAQILQQRYPHIGFLARWSAWLDRNWFNLILLYVGAHIFLKKDISVQIDPVARKEAMGIFSKHSGQAAALGLPVTLNSQPEVEYVPAVNVSQFKKINEAAAKKKSKPAEAVKGFSMRNLTPLLSPGYAKRKGIPQELSDAKLQVCKDYVSNYAAIAIEEMKAYQIPASITLAQGLLESDAGESVLATESNNHFGIKCRTKCLGCTCRNYSDDIIYDMFRVFDDVKESYREHSLLLNSPRYQHLKKLEATDYKGWAHGLKKAGYATDPKYAEKLTLIIEGLALYQYDRKA